MSISIGTIEGTLRFRDEATSQMNAFASSIEKHGKRMQKAGRQMSDVGGQLTRTLTLPMVAAGAAALKMATDLNAGMANVATLIPGNTKRVVELREEIQGLAVDVGKSTSDLTSGLYQTISAFGDTAETVELLEINARAATAGLSTTLEAIDLTSAVTKGYGDTSAEAVQKAADLALMTVRLGQTTFPELAASMGRVIPLAEAMGQSQEDLFAVFATATGVVGDAAKVATQYQGVINALMKPTADLSKLIKQQGFASGEAMLRQLGFLDTLQLIAETAKSSGKPLTEYIAQIEAVPLALALAGPQADVFREKLEAMAGAAGATDAAFREQTEGVNAAGHAWKQAKQDMVTALQDLGQELMPLATSGVGVLRQVTGMVQGMATALQALPSAGRGTVLTLAAIAAAAGPVLFVTGQILTAWGTLAATAPGVVGAIAWVGSAFLSWPAILAGALLGLNEVIKAWGRASEAAMRYQVELNRTNELTMALVRARIDGGVVDTETWEAAGAQIKKVQDRITELRKEIGDEGIDLFFLNRHRRAEIEGLERDLQNLRKGMQDLVPVSKEAAVEMRRLLSLSGAGLVAELAKVGIAVKNLRDLDELEAVTAALDALIAKQDDQQAANASAAAEAAAHAEAVRKAAEGLREGYIRTIVQSDALIASAERGGAALAALRRHFGALNEVTDAGIDPASRLGRELVALGVDAAAADKKLEIALGRLENAELRRVADEMRAIREEFFAIAETRPIDLTIPAAEAHSVAFTVDWEAVEASYRDFFGAAEKFHENYLRGLQESFADTFRNLFRDGKLGFEDFFRTVADLGINLFAEQLAAALTAAIEGAENAWKNLTKTMSSAAGQMAGWATAAGIVATAQNVDYAAIGAVLGAAVGAYFAGAATGGLGAWEGAALGASVGAWLGSMIKKGAPEFFGAVEMELGKLTIEASDLGGGAATVAKVFGDDLREAMTRVLEMIGGTLEGLGGGIDLKLKEGKLSVFIDGLAHHFKEDIEEGISFALTEALKRADISGASATFIQILQNTTAKSLEQLTEALDWGRWYERLRLGDVAADLQDRMFKFGQDIRRALEFGLPTDLITLDLGANFDAYRDQLLGIVETEEERIRRQAEAFNQWRQITEAEQAIRAAELIAQKASLEAEILLIRAGMEIDANHILFEQRMLEAEVAITSAEWELLHSKLQMLAAVEQALTIVQGILDSLPDLISDKDIQDAINRAGRRGGGGIDQVAQDLERLADILEQSARLGLSDYEQALLAIHDKWDAAIPLAHGNVEELEKINAAREREIELLREQQLLDFTATWQDFLDAATGGTGGSSFLNAMQAIDDRVADLGANLGQLAEDLDLSAHALLYFWSQVLAGADAMKRAAAVQGFLDMARGIANLTQNEELRHRLLMKVAQVEFDMRMALWNRELTLMELRHDLTEQEIALLREGMADIAAHRDLIIRAQVPVFGGGGGGGPDPADERARALQRLRDIQARALDPFSQAIRSVVDEFSELRRVLGWTAEVQAAYAQEIQRVLMEQLEPIRRLQEELAFRSDSPMRSIDQFRLAQKNLNEAVTALRGGDLSRLAAIPDLARMVLDLNPSSQASEATRFLFEMVNRILDDAAQAAEDAVTGIVPDTATDPFAWLRDTLTAGDKAIVRAIEGMQNSLGSELDDIETSADEIAGRLPEPEFDWRDVGVRTPGDDSRGDPSNVRRIASESREIELLQRVRELVNSNQSIDNTLKTGTFGVRAGVG